MTEIKLYCTCEAPYFNKDEDGFSRCSFCGKRPQNETPGAPQPYMDHLNEVADDILKMSLLDVATKWHVSTGTINQCQQKGLLPYKYKGAKWPPGQRLPEVVLNRLESGLKPEEVDDIFIKGIRKLQAKSTEELIGLERSLKIIEEKRIALQREIQAYEIALEKYRKRAGLNA